LTGRVGPSTRALRKNPAFLRRHELRRNTGFVLLYNRRFPD
jgi:hypothetical protein